MFLATDIGDEESATKDLTADELAIVNNLRVNGHHILDVNWHNDPKITVTLFLILFMVSE